VPQGSYNDGQRWQGHPATQAAGWGSSQQRARNPRDMAPVFPPQFKAVRDDQPRPAARFRYEQQPEPYGQPEPHQPARQPQYGSSWQPQQYAQARQLPSRPLRKTSMTAAEQFWYVLMCIGMGAGYFAKVPVKKALSDYGLAEMTAAEKFWYVLGCVPFGAMYFCKVPVAKAIEEMQRQSARPAWQ
jgi:hypothetical protein